DPGQRGTVVYVQLGTPRLDDENLTGEVHDIDFAVGGGGGSLEDFPALEVAGPDDLAGRFQTEQFFLVPIEHIELAFVEERRRHVTGELLRFERAGGLGRIFGRLHKALPGERRIGKVAVAAKFDRVDRRVLGTARQSDARAR